ncbi:hypothetical protein AK812_SmicGene48612, partial [Symbiodinium microadriaticum]
MEIYQRLARKLCRNYSHSLDKGNRANWEAGGVMGKAGAGAGGS